MDFILFILKCFSDALSQMNGNVNLPKGADIAATYGTTGGWLFLVSFFLLTLKENVRTNWQPEKSVIVPFCVSLVIMILYFAIIYYS